MRIFIGIEMDEQTRSVLKRTAGFLKSSTSRGNYTRAENYHLTVHFLGEISEQTLKDVMVCTEKTARAYEPFQMELGGIGFFKKKNRRVGWVGTGSGSYYLSEVYHHLKNELNGSGISISDNGYTPHITLGRQLKLEKEEDTLKREIHVPAQTFKVQYITVFESTRVDGVLTYVPIKRYEFGAHLLEKKGM